MEHIWPSPEIRKRQCAAGRAIRRNNLAASIAVWLAMVLPPSAANAQKVRISSLSDVEFGLIANPQAESRRSQGLCVFSNSAGNKYSVIASGSGPGASFALTNGPASLAYDVEWSTQSGQSSGTQLLANIALTGQTSAAAHQFCNVGPPTSTSLTIVLRAANLSQAQEGNYTGTLTLLIAAE